jgi:hypothetical protein
MMMRIVIEIDGDNVQVHTDRQLSETDTAKVTDAGSPPVDLLRQYAMDDAYDEPQQSRGKASSVKPVKDAPLNPLRAGEAVARRTGNYVERAGESIDVIDAGQAPRVPKVSQKQKTPKQRARKK